METIKWHKRNISAVTTLAYFLIIGGLACGIYFLAFFDTSVAVPGGQVFGIERVNNLGLMQDRQDGIYLGFGAAAMGLVIKLFYKRKEEIVKEVKSVSSSPQAKNQISIRRIALALGIVVVAVLIYLIFQIKFL